MGDRILFDRLTASLHLGRTIGNVLRAGIVLAVAAAAVAASARPATSPPLHLCGLVTGSFPAWNADGNSVAFARQGIWRMNPDGSGQRLLNGAFGNSVSHPSWSPDGSKIAFDTGNSGQIYVMNADGSDPRVVASGRYPSFAPGGRQLAFLELSDRYAATSLEVVNVDGSALRTLAADAHPDGGAPTWSPDGSTIAYGETREPPGTPVRFTPGLGLVDTNGNRRVRILQGDGYEPRWSLSGHWIARTTSVGAGGFELGLVRPDGTGADRLTDDVARDASYHPEGATWSPDGRQILYSSKPSDGSYRSAFSVIDASGRGRHRLAPGCRFGTGDADTIVGTSRVDRIFALEGADRIDVRGGGVDTVDCGRGRDRVLAGRRDRIARNCERVVRR
jgi:hypothetical protein